MNEWNTKNPGSIQVPDQCKQQCLHITNFVLKQLLSGPARSQDARHSGAGVSGVNGSTSSGTASRTGRQRSLAPGALNHWSSDINTGYLGAFDAESGHYSSSCHMLLECTIIRARPVSPLQIQQWLELRGPGASKIYDWTLIWSLLSVLIYSGYFLLPLCLCGSRPYISLARCFLPLITLKAGWRAALWTLWCVFSYYHQQYVSESVCLIYLP